MQKPTGTSAYFCTFLYVRYFIPYTILRIKSW